MKNKSLQGELLLLLTALIWGTAFVAQRVGVNLIEPFTFNSIRMFIGTITLLPCIYFFSERPKKTSGSSLSKNIKKQKKLLLGGISCGVILYIAGGLQQIALQYTTVSKAGFITALYIIIVPLLGIFIKKRPGGLLWFSVILAVYGMYLLCITGDFQISFGDGLMLLCALFFSLHILVIEYYSPFVNGIKMSCIQFFICGLLSTVTMFLLETPNLAFIRQAWFPLLYTGVMSCGIAYTLQILGQKQVDSVVASLIMSLESVFATIAGWLLLGESLSKREMTGCIFVFIAIIFAQLPSSALSLKEKKHTSL